MKETAETTYMRIQKDTIMMELKEGETGESVSRSGPASDAPQFGTITTFSGAFIK